MANFARPNHSKFSRIRARIHPANAASVLLVGLSLSVSANRGGWARCAKLTPANRLPVRTTVLVQFWGRHEDFFDFWSNKRL